MSSNKTATLAVVYFLAALLLPAFSSAQVISTRGNTSSASSQLVYYYDQLNESATSETVIQVTNTNDIQGTWIHIQVFRNFDQGENDLVFCDERDFIDFLTPNDTHIYNLGEANFVKNMGESEAISGEQTSIDVRDTKGFIVITPVVSESDLTAISFQHLAGISIDEFEPDGFSFILNALGRDAVDFTTGNILPDNTPLDGVTGGFVVIQPNELDFDFIGFDPPAINPLVDVIGFVFKDVYGDPGLLGYQVTPGDATWSPFIFDFKEDPTSCGNKQISCFATYGLNDTFLQHNIAFTDGLLCSGSSTPEYPGILDSHVGWSRIFVSGLGDFENHIGIFINNNTQATTRSTSSERTNDQVATAIILNGAVGGGYMFTN